MVKNLPAHTGDAGDAHAGDVGGAGSIPESGSSPGGGNGNLFQYYFLENSMGRGAWQTTAHGLQRVRHD